MELGVTFRTDMAGLVTGVRFYKSAANTGAHVGNLWTSSGALLGTVTFTSETASGWQEAVFGTPIAVTANTTYVVSYHTNAGHYSATGGYCERGRGHAAAPRVVGQRVSLNGTYHQHGAGGFPNASFNATNYWVDVVFHPWLGEATGRFFESPFRTPCASMTKSSASQPFRDPSCQDPQESQEPSDFR